MFTGVLPGEQAVSKAARQGSTPCTGADCRRGSTEKGAGLAPSELERADDAGSNPVVGPRICPDVVMDRIGPSEGPGPGSTPGRDTAQRMCLASVTDSTAAFEAARRGSIPRRGTYRI